MKINRTCIFLVVILAVCSAPLFAHEPSIHLNQGELRLGAHWAAMGGASYGNYWSFPDETFAYPDRVLLYPLTDQYMMSYGGDVESAEFGITNWLSAGLRLGLLDFSVRGFRDGAWRLNASLFSRAQILDLQRFKLHASIETWASPLFSVPAGNWIGDGLVNIFGSLSGNIRLTATESPHALFAFVDAMYITSVVGLTATPFNLSLGSLINLPADQLENVEIHYGNLNRIALATGFDYSYKGWTLGFGVAIPFYDILVNPMYSMVDDHLYDFRFVKTFFFNNFIFNWGYTFKF
jgi:hypothetical protein